MNTSKKTKLKLLTPLITLSLLLLILPVAQASFIDDVKNLLLRNQKNLAVEASISLAPGGDVDKNGVIDSGDIVQFSYKLSNPSDKKYSLTTLKTNVNTKEINTISNLKGTLSLDADKKEVVIPHLNIFPNQVLDISFEARVNFNKEKDSIISTDPELVDDKNASVFKGQRQEVIAKKMDIDTFNKFVHITQ